MVSSIHANLTKPGFTACAPELLLSRRRRAALFRSSGSHGLPLRRRYATSKGGLKTLTNALAVELGPLGIRVNAARPAASCAQPHRQRTRHQHADASRWLRGQRCWYVCNQTAQHALPFPDCIACAQASTRCPSSTRSAASASPRRLRRRVRLLRCARPLLCNVQRADVRPACSSWRSWATRRRAASSMGARCRSTAASAAACTTRTRPAARAAHCSAAHMHCMQRIAHAQLTHKCAHAVAL